MQSFLQKNKWSILAAGVAIQIFTGVPAAWGVFQKSVCEGYSLSQNAASMIFSFTICFFGVGCVLGGLLQDQKGPRAAGICGTLMLSAGFCAASFLPGERAWLFYLLFSVPVGMGCAFLYPAVMSCAQKWYADKKGFATGIIGGAVGASGAVLTFLGRWLIGTWNIRVAFFALGCVMLVVCGSATFLLQNPEFKTPKVQKVHQNGEYNVIEMCKTRQFWLLFLSIALATPAVLLFSPIIVELAQQRGLPENAALSCIIIGSLFSAAGRISMPLLSDKIGRKNVDVMLFFTLAALSICFIFAQNWLVILVYALLTFCYSGQAAVIPVAATDLFGQKNAGVNYGFLALGMSVGSIAFPLVANSLESELARHFIAITAAVLGTVCLLFLKPTHGDRL